MPHVAHIALGSNLGDRVAALHRALRLLDASRTVNRVPRFVGEAASAAGSGRPSQNPAAEAASPGTLRQRDLVVEAVSTFHETPSVGGPADAGDYLNAAARLATTLGPWQLLARLMQVEEKLGRRRPDLFNAPRPIDLDLLLFDDLVLIDPRLTLPHPRLHERRFVLAPLAEVSPALVHPVLGRSVAELLLDL